MQANVGPKFLHAETVVEDPERRRLLMASSSSASGELLIGSVSATIIVFDVGDWLFDVRAQIRYPSGRPYQKGGVIMY